MSAGRLARTGREIALLLRARMAIASLLLLALLSGLATLNGWLQVQSQQQRIDEARALQAQSAALVAARYGPGEDAGINAYHGFALAYDPPAPLAMLAIGQRDVAPWLLRVRALGLEAQLYEGDHALPELALAGRFDFAFVLVFLAPLFAIALLHDLVSSEREAGRARLLLTLPRGGASLWRRRALLRYAALAIALLWAPVLAAAIAGAGVVPTLGTVVIGLAYLGFWCALGVWVGCGRGSSGRHAARLVGLWLLLCLVLPALGQAALQRALPVDSGLDLMLAQREAVHDGWDRPKPDTFAVFFQAHPEWRDTPPVETRFHWKWYYALQHAGDMQVAELSSAYRTRLLQRERAGRQLGWLLPGVAAQASLHRLAGSDLEAHLGFLDTVRGFHEAQRRHLYPFVFEERPWTAAARASVPEYVPGSAHTALPATLLLMLLLALTATLVGATRAVRQAQA